MASMSDRPILHAAEVSRDAGDAGKPARCKVGVLALQGAFLEHVSFLRACGAEACLVRSAKDYEGIDGLVMPGGESTAMAIVAQRTGAWEPLQEWVDSGKPTWGTCAGMILLAKSAEGSKKGGQPLLSGMDIHVHRNFFGSQVRSFEAPVTVTSKYRDALGAESLPGVFIRAPAVLSVGEGVDVVATVRAARHDAHRPGEDTAEETDVIVAAVHGGSRMVTAFHPELTSSRAWHEYFVRMVEGHKAGAGDM